MMDWLKSKWAEGSTHAALTGVVAALLPLVPVQYQWVAQILAGYFTVNGVVKS